MQRAERSSLPHGVGSEPSLSPVLFDLERDRAERENLAGQIRLEADWLRSKLQAWIEAGRRLESGVPVDELDDETRETLRALGYLQ